MALGPLMYCAVSMGSFPSTKSSLLGTDIFPEL